MDYLKLNYDTADKEGEAFRQIDILYMINPKTRKTVLFAEFLANFNKISAKIHLNDYGKVTKIRSKLLPELNNLINI